MKPPQQQGAEAEERALLVLVAQNDRLAFERLYRIYHPRLWRFLDRITRRTHLVEEILNDTLLAVWRKPHGFNGECRLSTWIFAIAYNKAMKALERSDDPVDEDEHEEQLAVSPGPEGHAIASQRLASVQRALASLPLEQRTVVELTYFHDCDYREIAEVMTCPVDTVKTRMFHARRKLKHLLDGAREDLA